MKIKKTYLIIFFLVLFLLIFKFVVLKKPDTRLLFTIKKETFVEYIQVSGVFHKTATDTQKASALATYQNTLSALYTAKQNKEAADAVMWTKQQTVLTSQNNIDYKNENITNPATKKEYTDLEKTITDSALVQAEKDFRASEQKYKEADVSISAAQSQVNLAKLDYDDMLLDEPVITVNINEIYAPKIYKGQQATIVFDAFKDLQLKGYIKSIDQIGTNSSGVVTFETKIEIDDLPSTVKPNMTAVVNIEVIKKENTFAIPSSALILKEGKIYVQKSDDKNNNFTEVRLGEKGLVKVEVLSGLEDGDRILAKPDIKNL